MKVIVWTMLIAGALVGSFCLLKGLRSLVTALRRRPHLRRAPGTVITVHTTRETRSDSGGFYTCVTFHPEIEFTNELGQVVRFRSENGESKRVSAEIGGVVVEPVSRYRVGQTLEIFHDPAGTLPPCIATWAGLYGPGTALLCGGLGFLFGAALIWFCFGQKLLGP